MSGKIPQKIKPKKKRAPRGTFDRTAYMRDFMRKRRVFRTPKISITIGGVSV